jgi:type IV secretory pathway VirB10-like protein
MADEVQSIETTETPSNPVESKVEVEDLEQPKQVESEPVSAVSIPNTPAEPIAPVDTSADVQAGRQMETPPPETAQMGGDEPFLSRLLAKANLIIQGTKEKS